LSIEQTVVKLTSELRELGRKVGIEESLDAARALDLIGGESSDPVVFRAAIRATLIKDFDPKQDDDSSDRRNRTETFVQNRVEDRSVGKGMPYPDVSEEEGENQDKKKDLRFGRYSPLGIEVKQKAPHISKAEEKRWSSGAENFKRSILTLEGHRFKKSALGQINLRRTLLLDLKKAGDSTALFRSMKKITKANIVLLCDVSGSMSDSNPKVVNLCCSFKKAVPKSEIFLFSTRLKKVTYYAAKYGPKELALRIPELDLGFGGGTKIGLCLARFRRSYGYLLTRKTTIIIFSDGWDIGDVSLLKREMIEIQKRTNRIIWINPLLDSKDYVVETAGMRVALEYVDYFVSPKSLLEQQVVQRTFTKN
jgi:uncharacterized protein